MYGLSNSVFIIGKKNEEDDGYLDSINMNPPHEKTYKPKRPTLWQYRFAYRAWKGLSFGLPIDEEKFLKDYKIDHRKAAFRERFEDSVKEEYFMCLRFNPEELDKLAQEVVSKAEEFIILLKSKENWIKYLEYLDKMSGEKHKEHTEEEYIDDLNKMISISENKDRFKIFLLLVFKYGWKDLREFICKSQAFKQFSEKYYDRWCKENEPIIMFKLHQIALDQYLSRKDRKPYIEATGIDRSEDLNYLFGGPRIWRLCPEELSFEIPYKEEISHGTRIEFNNQLYACLPKYFEVIGNEREVKALAENDSNDVPKPYFFTDGRYQFLSDERRFINIGKIITRLIEEDKNNEVYRNLEKILSQKNQPKVNKRFSVIISRHPVDICSMSTGRGWTSCMNLHDGCNKSYALTAAKYGLMIAYLCRSEDINSRKQFKNPLGRILIKPYTRTDKNARPHEMNIIYRVSCAYGTFYDPFVKATQDWLNEKWNFRVMKDDESFKFLDYDNIYFDDTRNKYFDLQKIGKEDLLIKI